MPMQSDLLRIWCDEFWLCVRPGGAFCFISQLFMRKSLALCTHTENAEILIRNTLGESDDFDDSTGLDETW